MEKRTLAAFAVLMAVVAVSASAVASYMVVSKPLSEVNVVPDDAVTLSRMNVVASGPRGGVEYANLPASPAKGVTYDLGVNASFLAVDGLGRINMTVSVEKVGIVWSDVDVKVWDGASWSTVGLADNGNGGLTCEISVTESPLTGASVEMYFLVTYLAGGSYTLTFQAVSR